MLMIMLNIQEIKCLEKWFDDEGYKILKLYDLVKYLCDHYYIRTREDVVLRNMELHGAENVPLDWLDYDTIIYQDDDFYELGYDRYLNVFEITEELTLDNDSELFKYVKEE